MAQHFVRKETAGSIFYRVTGLLRSGQMKWKERPLWYDVYVANPPKYEPTAIAPFPGQNEPIRPLFYKEDIARVRFYGQFRSLGAININNEESKSLCQKFTELYQTIERMWPELSEDKLYEKALVALSEKLKMQEQKNGDQSPEITER